MRRSLSGRMVAALASLLAVTVVSSGTAQERSSKSAAAQGQTSETRADQPSQPSGTAAGVRASGQTAVANPPAASSRSANEAPSRREDRTTAEREQGKRQRASGQVRGNRQSSTAERHTESRGATAGEQASDRQGLDRQIAHWLILGNQAEVTLGQFAAPRAQHQSVKQFAQHMVQDHSQAAEQLQKAALGEEGGAEVGAAHSSTTTRQSATVESGASASTSGESESRRADPSRPALAPQAATSGLGTALSGQPIPSDSSQDRSGASPAGSDSQAERVRGGQATDSATGQSTSTRPSGETSAIPSHSSAQADRASEAGQSSPSSPPAQAGSTSSRQLGPTGTSSSSGQTSSTLSQDRSSTPSDGTAPGSSRTDARGAVHTTGYRGEHLGALSGGDSLLQIQSEICRRSGELTQRELGTKQGAEFDKAYIGQQIVSHIDMLATLQAAQPHVSSDLQPVIQKGIQKTEQHLSQAKQILQQLEGQGNDAPSRGAPAGGQRSDN